MPGGRPTKYNKEYNEQVEKLCMLSATDKDIADFFKVSERTLNYWKKNNKQFLQSLKRGKEKADTDVAESLYNRATGYKHQDTYFSNYKGVISKTLYTKHYAPDPTSMIFWLKNRRPDLWRDKHELEAHHTGDIHVTIRTGGDKSEKPGKKVK